MAGEPLLVGWKWASKQRKGGEGQPPGPGHTAAPPAPPRGAVSLEGPGQKRGEGHCQPVTVKPTAFLERVTVPSWAQCIRPGFQLLGQGPKARTSPESCLREDLLGAGARSGAFCTLGLSPGTGSRDSQMRGHLSAEWRL